MTAFGGIFTSRISQEIREKRGWSYAAWATYMARADIGWWTARTFPSNDHAFETLCVMCDMLDALQADGLQSEEYRYAADTLIASAAFKLQTDKRRLEDAINLFLLKQPSDTTEKWPEIIRSTPLDSVNKALEKLQWPQAACVLVGDAKSLESSLLNWPRAPRIHRMTPDDIIYDRWP